MRCFGDREAPSKGPAAPKPVPPTRPAHNTPPTAVPAHDPARRPHDGSRTRVEARVAFPEPGEGPEEIATPTRRFSWRDVTSGLADDSREDDERREEWRIRDLRGRVKAARAVVATTPGLAETLATDWQKATRFYGRFGITEVMFRSGVPSDYADESGPLPVGLKP